MKDILNSWKVTPIQQSENHALLKQFLGEKSGYIQVGPNKYFFPKKFAELGPDFYSFKPRPDDTWVVTFPRSGTTLTQELVWLLSNNFDYDTAAEIPLTERFPFLEFSACVNDDFLSELLLQAKDETKRQNLVKVSKNILPALEMSNKRRFIKTHLPLSLLHPELLTCGAKVIYVARNPKDVAVSYYHLHRLFKTLDFVGTFKEFWNHFENDHLLWSPFWNHINEAWDVRHNSNLIFLFYEEMQKNMKKSIQRISNFLGVEANIEEVDGLARHLDISRFRNNSSVNFEDLRGLGILNDTSHRFIRNGVSNPCIKPDFSPDLEKQAEIWIKKNLRETSLRFPE